jgi:hypothetical protein
MIGPVQQIYLLATARPLRGWLTQVTTSSSLAGSGRQGTSPRHVHDALPLRHPYWHHSPEYMPKPGGGHAVRDALM